MAEKNMLVAVILSFLLTGLGLVYDGLTVRGVVCFCIAIILGLLSYFISPIFTYIGYIWVLYVLYDTYQCTKAINEYQPIPLFLTQFDLQ